MVRKIRFMICLLIPILMLSGCVSSTTGESPSPDSVTILSNTQSSGCSFSQGLSFDSVTGVTYIVVHANKNVGDMKYAYDIVSTPRLSADGTFYNKEKAASLPSASDHPKTDAEALVVSESITDFWDSSPYSTYILVDVVTGVNYIVYQTGEGVSIAPRYNLDGTLYLTNGNPQ